MKRSLAAIATLFFVFSTTSLYAAGTVVLGKPYRVTTGITNNDTADTKGQQLKAKSGEEGPCFAIDAIWTTGAGDTTAVDATETFTFSGEILRVEAQELVEGEVTEDFAVTLLNEYGVDLLNGKLAAVSGTMTSAANTWTILDSEGARIQRTNETAYWSVSGAGNSNTGRLRIIIRSMK